jgi:isopenicillin-N N-acyltransferase like protein
VTLRVVHAEGDPADRGRTIGRELGDLINHSVAFYREYLRGVGNFETVVAPYRSAAERSLPDHTATLAAMAAAAEVSPAELFAVNACEELETLAAAGIGGRCSSFAAAVPGATILAHNEQWFAADAANVAVVVEHPAQGVAIASPTVASCLPAVGMNALCGGQAIDSLTARDDGVGVPRVFVSRHALEAADREDAVRRAGLPGRAGGYAHVFAFAGGQTVTLETTTGAVAVLAGPAAHTNHYLDPRLAELGDEPALGSVSRYERLRELLAERPPASPEEAMEILRDHESAPQAICKHAAPGADEESTVVFSMVCELESRRMWVAAGNPCETPFEQVELGL